MEPDGTNEPYRVIGVLNPLQGIDGKAVKVSAMEATLENALDRCLTLAGFRTLHTVIRSPEKDRNFNGASCEPHQDNYYGDWFVVWASANPTVILVTATGERYYPEPYQMVLVNDKLTKHHKPANVPGRWFARVAVERIIPSGTIRQKEARRQAKRRSK